MIDQCEHGAFFSDFCALCAHQPVEEWAGFPVTICQFCGVPWPCDESGHTDA